MTLKKQDWRLSQTPPGSPCGSCAVCCIYPPFPEIDKQQDKKCQHLSERGCTIYPSRHATCRAYQCMWLISSLDGHGSPLKPADRPDRSGLLIEELDKRDGSLLIASLWEGAMHEPYGKDLLSRLSRSIAVPIKVRNARGPGRHCAISAGAVIDFEDFEGM